MHYEIDWRASHDVKEPELAGDIAIEWFGICAILLISVIGGLIIRALF